MVVFRSEYVNLGAADGYVIKSGRLWVVLRDERLVLTGRNKADGLHEPVGGCSVEKPEAVTRPTHPSPALVDITRRYEPERQEQCLDVPRKGLARRRPICVAIVGVAVGLKQSPHKRGVYVAIVGMQDRVGNPRRPALPAVPVEGRALGEAASVPPDRERDGVERDLVVTLTRKHVTLEAEQSLTEFQKSLQDLVVAIGHAQPDSLCM